MRSLVSGVVGALAALVLVTAWHGGTSADERAAAGALDARLATVQGDPGAAPVNVQCAPGQRAVVRQLQTGAGQASFIECVAQAEQDLLVMSGANAFIPATYQTPGVSPRVVPAVTTTAAAPERVVYRTVERKPSSSRTWKKTAMVIGGSAGAGAGVGALAGGKKGALIGAAIGGGAATLYEAAKRR